MLKEMKNKNSEKAITLIALVITIIILLILAGVTIANLTGEKGIIKEARTAAEKMELASLEEQVELAIITAESKHKNPTLNNVIDELKNNKVISDPDQVDTKTGAITTDLGYVIEGKLNDYIGKISTGDNNETGGGNSTGGGNTTGGGDTPTPPVNTPAVPGEIVTGQNKEYENNGKAVIPVDFAIVPGLDDVSEGLVISDVANDTQNQGNQFVWIPVTSETEYKRNTSFVNTVISAKAIDDTDYLPEGITNEEEAVRSAGGFYIARYEAGKEGTDTLVSKKGATVWNNISQTDAKTEAKTMFPNNENIKSALISGIQWDLTMSFVNGKKDGLGDTYDVTTSSSTRHNGGGITRSGYNEADRVCNIYDLEGNVREYIAEKNTYSTSSPYVYRGGYYNRNSVPVSYRDSFNGIADRYYSFRFALYVK